MSELIEMYKESVRKQKSSIFNFFTVLKKNPASRSVENFCLWLIEQQLIEPDYLAVSQALLELVHRRNRIILDRIKLLMQKLSQKDPEFQRYRSDFEYLIAILENAASSNCNCTIYQDSTFNIPPYQEDLQELERRSSPPDQEYNSYTIQVKCKGCGKIWDVEIDETYHYPHSHWRLVK